MLSLDKKNELIQIAKNAKKHAYAPYSNFKVGVALRSKNGKIFTGCNVENVSYGLTVCAERVAVFKAVSEGYTEFDSIGISSSSETPAFPCGACRQVLAEFGDLEIFLDNDEKTYRLSDLLPHSFDKNQM